MLTILLIPFFLTSVVPQEQDAADNLIRDTLAVVDNSPITALDLFERVQMMPFEAKMTDRDFESVKRKAVESLVGERLLSLSAPALPDSGKWRLETMGAVLRKMFTRDAMYRKEIHNRATVSDREVRQNLSRYGVRRQLLAVTPASVELAKKFAAQWRRRRSLGDSNARIISAAGFQPDTIYITLGSIDTSLEEAAFALKDTLDISSPVQSKLFGILVLTLLRDEPSSDASKKSMSQRERAVRDLLRDRKEQLLSQAFVDPLFHGQRMEADSGLFRRLTRKLWEIMREDTSARSVPGGYRYLPEDAYRLLDEFHSVRDTPVVHGSFGVLRVGEFLESLLHYDFVIPSLKPRKFAAAFFDILRAMTEAEIIAQEGLRRGYQYNSEVQRDLSIWSGYWQSRSAEFNVVDTVTIQPWEASWSMWRYNPAVVETTCFLSVQEILRPDSASALAMAEMLRNGVDMDSLARIHSIRTEWRENGGRSGWFSSKDRWELTGHIMMMNVGETKGPVKLAEGYSVVRLLGRKFAGDGADSLFRLEGRRVRVAHQQAVLNRHLAEEAIGHNVKIFYDKIPHAEVENVDMFTRRLLGFGGKVNAAPLLIPQWDWVEEWKNMQKKVP